MSKDNDVIDYQKAQLMASIERLSNNEDFEEFLKEIYKCQEAHHAQAHLFALMGENDKALAFLNKAAGLKEAIGEFNALSAQVDFQSQA